MATFSALTGGGGDEDDVSAGGLEWNTSRGLTRTSGAWAGQHVGGGGVDQAKDAVDVGGLGEAPLGGGHGGDGGFDGRPDAVVGNEDVEVAKSCESGGDERLSVFGGGEVLLDRPAEFGATTFCGEGMSLIGGGTIAEGDPGTGLAEKTDCGCANAARSSSDESGAADEGE